MLSTVAREAADALRAPAALVAVRGAPDRHMRLVAVHGLPWHVAADLHRSLRTVEERLVPPVAIHVDNAHDPDSGIAELRPWTTSGLAAVVASPIQLRGEFVGVLHTVGHTGGFDARSGHVAEAFANQAALTLNYRRLRQRSRHLSGRLTTALGLDELILDSHDFDDLSAAVTDRVSEVLGVEKSGVMLLDEDRDVLKMTTGSFRATPEMISSCQFPAYGDRTGTARVFTTGEPLISNDAPNDPLLRQDFISLFNTKRIMVLPLRVQGRRIGALQVSNKPTPFEAEDLEKAQILAPRVGSILELGRMVFRLRRQQALERILSELAVGIAARSAVGELLARTLRNMTREVGADFIALTLTKTAAPIVHVADAGAVTDERRRALLDGAHRRSAQVSIRSPERPGDPGSTTLYEPISVGAIRLGTLVTYRSRAESFGESERGALARLASMTGLAMHTERFERQRADLRLLRDRQRFAEGLHDDVAQLLFIAKLKLEAVLEDDGLREADKESLTDACRLLERGDSAIREVITTLSPGPESAPLTRLGVLIEELEEEFGVPIHLQVASELQVRLPPMRRSVADIIPRAANEAIVNAIKHARPQLISVALRFNRDRGCVELGVRDDGIGFANGASTDSYGLASLERSLGDHGGVMTVIPGPRGGTEVVAQFPVEA